MGGSQLGRSELGRSIDFIRLNALIKYWRSEYRRRLSVFAAMLREFSQCSGGRKQRLLLEYFEPAGQRLDGK